MLHACSRTPAAAQVGGISELLAQRSAVDLKDKWRNLVSLGCGFDFWHWQRAVQTNALKGAAGGARQPQMPCGSPRTA